jgi:hypothetical protein
MLVVLGFFVAGTIFGCFEIGRIAGMVCLGIMGGISFGVRITLLRAGLIFGAGDDGSGPGYILAWAMIAVFGVLGGLWIALAKFQRSGMVGVFFFGGLWKKPIKRTLIALCLCRCWHLSRHSWD